MTQSELAILYETRYRVPFSGRSYHDAVQRDVTVLQAVVAPNQSLLICDLCCGRGTHIARLSEIPGYSVVGVDFSKAAESAFYGTYGKSTRAKFVCDSVDNFVRSTKSRFDVTLCYLPHIDARFEGATRALLTSMWTLCADAGVSIISFLCHDYAGMLPSMTQAVYDAESNVIVTSYVQYASNVHHLRISQRSPLWDGQLIEDMQLYGIAEMEELLRLVGYTSVQRIADYDSLASVEQIQRAEECKATIIAHRYANE